MSTVLSGGRLPVKARKEVVDFVSSRESDRKIARSIVLVNEAHVLALSKANLVSKKEARRLMEELRKLENRFPNRGIEEDYHLFIEEELTNKLGAELGGKIHAGKSRNDQVATALRVTLRGSLLGLSEILLSFVDTMLSQATKYSNNLFVGYTHLQPAQPITYGHYLLAITDSLLRDNDRILEAYGRVNRSPMGAGAIAGSSFNLDRRLVASLLGFGGLIENSLDAIGSRDFLLESLSVCSLIASDISRAAQDWIFYSSADVGLLEVTDDYSSTSSIMPQKKNPDPLEVVRARCASIIGNYTSALAMMHALPSGYNLDFQELTPLIWNSIDSLDSSLSMITGLIASAKPRPDIVDRYPVKFTVATEVANFLVRETGIPFRQAYRWVGQAVRIALESQRTIADLSRSEWGKIMSMAIDERTYRKLNQIAEIRSHPGVYRTEGSPNPSEVSRMIRSRKRELKEKLALVGRLSAQTNSATQRLRKAL